MPAHHPPVRGTSNSGPTSRTPGRNHNPTATYEFDGTVRWYDGGADSCRFVVHVRATNHHAGRFLDEDVTFAPAPGVDAPEGLLPGVAVQVRARMPRDLGPDAPDPITATRIGLLD